jgi:hypothetical protein
MRIQFRRFIPAALSVLLLSGAVDAQTRKIDAKGRAEAVNRIADLFNGNYILPQLGEQGSTFLKEQLANGAYDKLGDTAAFGDRLTEDIRSVTHDRHIKITPMPPSPAVTKDAKAEQERRDNLYADARRNFFFNKVERFSGNVGYLDMRRFSPVEEGGATAIAAMNFLANSDAVIIDVRYNGGGDNTMVQLISSYFFKEPAHLNNMYWRRGDKAGLLDITTAGNKEAVWRGGDRTDQFWTLPYVPGKRMPDVPLYILTSVHTLSAAEEFTNNLKELKRAKIIGETTGGAANPFDVFPINDDLVVFVPVGKAVNPVTGKNWEGAGVQPDVKVPAEDALTVAYNEALKEIAANPKSAESKSEALWAQAAVEAQRRPAKISPGALQQYVGDYESRRITLEDGSLYFHSVDRPHFKIASMTSETFSIEGLDMRLRFTFDKSGKPAALAEIFIDGRRNEFARR